MNKLERTDRMIDILSDEWENFVVIASRVEDGSTVYFHARRGNNFALEKMMEHEMNDMVFGGIYGGEEEDEG